MIGIITITSVYITLLLQRAKRSGKKLAGMAKAFGFEFAPHIWSNGVGLTVNLHPLATNHAE